jgi:hypothetical protein
MHFFSILEKSSGKDGRHEVDLWSLVLEPIPGEVERYRRVGIARKAVYVPENEVLDGKEVDDTRIPKVFESWKHREVVII